jgi:Flp pilus assembly protein TadD
VRRFTWMRLPRLLLPVLLLLLIRICVVSAQTAGSVSGFIQDQEGNGLAGVPLTLSNEGAPSVALIHTTTDKQGEYRISGLAFGTYRLSTDQPGSVITPSGAFTLSAPNPELRMNFSLKPPLAQEANSPTDKTSTTSNLNLKAAGIRGYIDPGGYSAPAGAAAATDLVRGIAGIKRMDNRADGDNELPCSLQTGLLQAVAEHPVDAGANERLGRLYLAHNQPSQALPYLQRAWTLNRGNSETLTFLSNALLQTNQFLAAHDLLMDNATDHNTAETHRMLARADEGLGLFVDASQQYQAAASLQSVEENLFGVGYELILAGSPGKAAKAFEAGAKQFPNSTIMLVGNGTAVFLQGQSTEATSVFLRAVHLNPSDPRPYPFLSASFGISGTETDSVRASFQRFYELAPNNAEAAYFYATSLLHPSPGSAPVDSNHVEALLQRSIQLDPHFAKAHFQLGSIYLQQRNYAKAAMEFETALRSDPDMWEAHYKLSAAYKRIGQSERAEQEMHLFLTHGSQKASEGQASNINIKEFLSVFNLPQSVSGQQTACVIDPQK